MEPTEKILPEGISMRCGKGSCEFYNPHNKISGCKIFDDRRKCSISMKQRRKSKGKSKKRGHEGYYGI
jgi:hypothetical protein